MNRIYKAAKQCGYLKNVIEPIDPRDAKKISKERVLYLCTGSQGEPMGALNRIVNEIHPDVTLEVLAIQLFFHQKLFLEMKKNFIGFKI